MSAHDSGSSSSNNNAQLERRPSLARTGRLTRSSRAGSSLAAVLADDDDDQQADAADENEATAHARDVVSRKHRSIASASQPPSEVTATAQTTSAYRNSAPPSRGNSTASTASSSQLDDNSHGSASSATDLSISLDTLPTTRTSPSSPSAHLAANHHQQQQPSMMNAAAMSRQRSADQTSTGSSGGFVSPQRLANASLAPAPAAVRRSSSSTSASARSINSGFVVTSRPKQYIPPSPSSSQHAQLSAAPSSSGSSAATSTSRSYTHVSDASYARPMPMTVSAPPSVPSSPPPLADSLAQYRQLHQVHHQTQVYGTSPDAASSLLLSPNQAIVTTTSTAAAAAVSTSSVFSSSPPALNRTTSATSSRSSQHQSSSRRPSSSFERRNSLGASRSISGSIGPPDSASVASRTSSRRSQRSSAPRGLDLRDLGPAFASSLLLGGAGEALPPQHTTGVAPTATLIAAHQQNGSSTSEGGGGGGGASATGTEPKTTLTLSSSIDARGRRTVNQYVRLRTIGQGSHGKVWLCAEPKVRGARARALRQAAAAASAAAAAAAATTTTTRQSRTGLVVTGADAEAVADEEDEDEDDRFDRDATGGLTTPREEAPGARLQHTAAPSMSASAGDEIEAALDLGDVELCAIKSVARDPRPGLGRSHGSRGAPKSLRNARALREQRQKSAIALQDAASAGAEGQQLYDHPPNSASSGGIGGDDKVKREVAIMKRLNHPNVVRLKEVIDDAKSKKVFMVLEFMAGGQVVWQDDNKQPTMTVDEARRTFRDVVLGLEYLHYQGIIHRDIKPANLLWTADRKRVKISDFGVSHVSDALMRATPGKGNEDDKALRKTAGSPAFFAPELCHPAEFMRTPEELHDVPTPLPTNDINSPDRVSYISSEDASRHSSRDASANSSLARLNLSAYISPYISLPLPPPSPSTPRTRPPVGRGIDIWALGVTLYCLLFGDVPFMANTEFELYNKIANEPVRVPERMGREQAWTGVGEPVANAGDGAEGREVVDLLGKLLEKDPAKRIELDAVKKHPWVLRNLTSPEAWLSETDLKQSDTVVITDEDVRQATQERGKSRDLPKMRSRAGLGSVLKAALLRFPDFGRRSKASKTATTTASSSAPRSRSKSGSSASPSLTGESGAEIERQSTRLTNEMSEYAARVRSREASSTPSRRETSPSPAPSSGGMISRWASLSRRGGGVAPQSGDSSVQPQSPQPTTPSGGTQLTLSRTMSNSSQAPFGFLSRRRSHDMYRASSINSGRVLSPPPPDSASRRKPLLKMLERFGGRRSRAQSRKSSTDDDGRSLAESSVDYLADDSAEASQGAFSPNVASAPARNRSSLALGSDTTFSEAGFADFIDSSDYSSDEYGDEDGYELDDDDDDDVDLAHPEAVADSISGWRRGFYSNTADTSGVMHTHDEAEEEHLPNDSPADRRHALPEIAEPSQTPVHAGFSNPPLSPSVAAENLATPRATHIADDGDTVHRGRTGRRAWDDMDMDAKRPIFMREYSDTPSQRSLSSLSSRHDGSIRSGVETSTASQHSTTDTVSASGSRPMESPSLTPTATTSTFTSSKPRFPIYDDYSGWCDDAVEEDEETEVMIAPKRKRAATVGGV